MKKRMLLAILLLAPAQSLYAKSKPTPKIKNPPTFGEWFAVGSGCKATHKSPGNVKFVGNEYEGQNAITGRFELTGYKLSSPPENPKTSISFARECNLRVQVQPPQGKKIVSVSSKAMFVASKETNVKLNLQNTLYMDTRMVGAFQAELPKGEQVGNRDFEVVLSRGLWKGLADPQGAPAAEYGCGQPMVFGSDFTAITHRQDAKDTASVTLAGASKSLEFSVELEDCKPSAP
jgi:hypothetical protein